MIFVCKKERTYRLKYAFGNLETRFPCLLGNDGRKERIWGLIFESLIEFMLKMLSKSYSDKWNFIKNFGHPFWVLLIFTRQIIKFNWLKCYFIILALSNIDSESQIMKKSELWIWIEIMNVYYNKYRQYQIFFFCPILSP